MSSPESSAHAPARRWLLALALLALFTGALTLFTQQNRYPYFYHPDEYGKCRQIVDGTRSFNFNHPLLLLNVAKPIYKMAGKGTDDGKPAQLQKAVIAGRTASAIFAALTVVALVVAAGLIGGPSAAIGTALVLTFHPLLFEHAHNFKEDTALTMGLAFTCMAALLFWKAPGDRGRAILLGVATACAVSGKYVGFTALVIALPVIIFAPGEQRGRRFGVFAAALVLTFVVANYQMFTHLSEWRQSLSREVGMSVSGSRGVVAQNPIGYYRSWFSQTVPTAALVFLALNALNLCTTARRRSLADWLVFAFPFLFTAMLMASPRISDRYFLPAAVLFNFNAVVGVGVSAEWFTRAFGRFRCVGQCVLTAIVLCFGWHQQVATFRKTFWQFRFDDRRELETWMTENLPAGSRVAQDSAIGLPDPEHHKQKGMKREFKHEVLGSEFVADLGTLDELRAKGVRYIATTPKKSQRYTDGAMTPNADAQDEFERRKAFYNSLPEQGKILWERKIAEIDTLHPGIILYDISPRQ